MTTKPPGARPSRFSAASPTKHGIEGEWRMRCLSTSADWRTSLSDTSAITCAYCATDTECDAAVEVDVALHPPGALGLDFRKHVPAVNAHAHQPAQPPAPVAEELVRRLLPQRHANLVEQSRVDPREVALVIPVIVQRDEESRTDERVEIDRVAEGREDVRCDSAEAIAG